jgi:HAD superfamily hydrolase (TIGR01509 family)
MAAKRHGTALLFDLDGTLVDNDYQHILAWREAFEAGGIAMSQWRIQRKIGMSGTVFVASLLREIDRKATEAEKKRLEQLHSEAYERLADQARPQPGARELLTELDKRTVPWAIATSAAKKDAHTGLDILKLRPDATIITRDDVENAKPEPDLFLAAAGRLNVPLSDAAVVGDSIWDLLAARRARAIGVGLLSGGIGRDELERAGAYRVYDDTADLLRHIDELGIIEGS